jgi:PAS domain S-box-containing protein
MPIDSQSDSLPESGQDSISFKWRAILAILALTILAGGSAYYRAERARIKREELRTILGNGKLKAAQIEQWRFERLADAKVSAQDPVLIAAARAFRRDGDTIVLRKTMRASLDIRAKAYRYTDILFLSSDGSYLFSVSGTVPDSESIGPESMRAVSQVLAGGEPIMSGFHRLPDGALRVDAVAAITDTGGAVLGVLNLRSDPRIFFKPLLLMWPSVAGNLAKNWLAEHNGDQVDYLGGDVRSESDLAWAKSPLSEAPPAVRAALSGKLTFDGEDRGRDVLAGSSPVSGSPWRIISQIDAHDVLADGLSRARSILIMAFASLAILASAFAVLHRQRLATLYKTRYLAERRRRQDQEERRALLDSIGDAVITTDTHGRVREVNPAAAVLTGWAEAEAQNRPLEEVFRVTEKVERRKPAPLPGESLLPASEASESHSVLVRRDGGERPVIRSSSPIRGLDGEATGSVVVFSDQSRQHAAIQALYRSEAKFRNAMESINLIALILDEAGCVSVCSDYFLELTGWPREDVIGRGWFDRFVPEEERPKRRETFRRSFEIGGIAKHSEYEIVTRRGRRHLIAWSNNGLRDAQGRMVGLVCIGEDITERKQAEDRLRQSENRLKLLVEHCPGAIAMFDLEMRYLVVSPRWLEDFHLGTEQVIGRSHYEVFPDIPQRWKDIHSRCLKGANEKHDEDPFPRASGGTEWVRWEIHPWIDDRGEIGGIVMFTEVVTQRKEAQEALKRLNAELEQRVQERTAQLAEKNKELETFSYSVSHDLKAPLRGIDGYSKILLDEYADHIDEEGRGFLKNIRAGTEQMRQLIEDMLAYSRLERRSLSLEPLDLGEVVRRVMEERRFDLGGAEVQISLSEGMVKADHDGVAIVLRNLIDNAVKFSRQRKPPEIRIASRIDAGRHILSIRDNGTGFAMKHHDLIFQIFQRLHRSEDYGGTGVGLAIVKKAVDRMQGRVWAESEPDRGATFYIELPCAETPN